jgi:hypothetical protein
VGTNADEINDSLEGNVISGNSLIGISVGSQHVVAGNLVGTDVSGVLPLGNGVGIMLDGNDSQIGGSTLASRNTISGNVGSGIDVNNIYVTGNAVLDNAIGVNVLNEPLGNGLDGIWMRFGAISSDWRRRSWRGQCDRIQSAQRRYRIRDAQAIHADRRLQADFDPR